MTVKWKLQRCSTGPRRGMTGYKYPSCEPISWTALALRAVPSRTIAGLTCSPLERGRDPLSRVANLQKAQAHLPSGQRGCAKRRLPVHRLLRSTRLPIRAAQVRSICTSHQVTRCCFSHLLHAEGYRSTRHATCDCTFPVQTPPSPPGSPPKSKRCNE